MSAPPTPTAGAPDCPRCGSPREGGLCPRCLIDEALAPEPATGEAPALPRRIGHYRLLEELARGGGGVVYRAWQEDLQREVAVKTLLPERLGTLDARKRFWRESEAMARLDNPGILPIYEVGASDGEPWFAMKLAPGGNLAARVPALHGEWRTIAELVARIARAVGHAHERGVLHRDLKPSNIVFAADDTPLVTDFGLARYLSRDSSLTGMDSLIGTPRYTAPELLAGREAPPTPAVDVYGLGAILYELLTGEPPFAALPPLQILHQAASRSPRPPRQLDTDIPRGLEAICMRCLERQPRDRYADGNALAGALDAWLAREGRLRSRFPGARLVLPSRRRRLAVAAGALLVLAGGLLAWHLATRPPVPIPDPAVATQRVLVLPDLVRINPANTAAARRLAGHLELPPPLSLASFDQALAAEQADRIRADTSADAAAGGFIHVLIGERPRGPGFLLQAWDSLREEVLYETAFAAGEEARVAPALAAALAEKRSRPPPEARLSRRGLGDLLQGAWLLMDPGEKEIAAAITRLERAIERHPEQALPRVWLAEAYLLRPGDAFWLDSAIDHAARAERLDPSLGLATKTLGLAYQRKGWLGRAVASYERAQGLHTLFTEAPLGWVYYQQGRFADAWRMYRQMEIYGSDGYYSPLLGGHVLLAAGFTDAGEALLDEAARRIDDVRVHRLLAAEVAFHRADYAACGTTLADLPPGLGDGYFNVAELRGRCALGAEDPAGALASAEAKWREQPPEAMSNRAPPMLPVAILRSRLGDGESTAELLAASRQALQAAIDSGDEFPATWLRLAALETLEGNEAGARTALERAFELGLAMSADTRLAPEFLPFRDDPRFADLREQAAGELAAARRAIAADLPDPPPGGATPAATGQPPP